MWQLVQAGVTALLHGWPLCFEGLVKSPPVVGPASLGRPHCTAPRTRSSRQEEADKRRSWVSREQSLFRRPVSNSDNKASLGAFLRNGP